MKKVQKCSDYGTAIKEHMYATKTRRAPKKPKPTKGSQIKQQIEKKRESRFLAQSILH